MTMSDDLLDRLARDLGYRLDILALRREVNDGWLRGKTLMNQVKIVATSYGITTDEVEDQILNLGKVTYLGGI